MDAQHLYELLERMTAEERKSLEVVYYHGECDAFVDGVEASVRELYRPSEFGESSYGSDLLYKSTVDSLADINGGRSEQKFSKSRFAKRVKRYLCIYHGPIYSRTENP